MGQYVIEDAAAAELEAAVVWHHQQREGLGDELLSEFHERMLLAIEQPGAGTLAGHTSDGGEIRRYRLHKFKRYSILIAIRDGVPTVLVFEHSSRKPYYWRSRLQ